MLAELKERVNRQYFEMWPEDEEEKPSKWELFQGILAVSGIAVLAYFWFRYL